MNIQHWFFNNFVSRKIFNIIYNYKRISFLHNFNIRQKLIIAFLAIGILPLILLGIIQYTIFLKTMPSQVGDGIMQTLEQADKNINYELNSINRQLYHLQINKALLDEISNSPGTDENKAISKIKKIREVLSNYQASSQITMSIFVDWATPYKELFNDNSVILVQTEKELQWYQELSNKQTGISWVGSHKLPLTTSSADYISGITVIRDFTNNTFGIIDLHMNTQTFENIIKDIRIGDRGTVLFLDGEYNTITEGPDAPLVDSNIIELKKILTEKKKTNINSGMIKAKLGSTQVLTIYKTNAITGWTLVGVIPIEETMKSANLMGTTTFVIILVCILAAIVLAVPLSFSMSNPIRRIISVMKVVQEENFDVSVKSTSNDEIGQLCSCFNVMIAKIKELIEKVYKVEIEKKEEELKVLQAQINPHFLYNTLDTIHWLSLLKGVNEISLMSRSLANFFRYALSKGNVIIPVKDEIDLAKNYIQIQKIRLNEQLEVVYDIDQEIFGYKTIKLILQPLIENSILHGIKEPEDIIKIAIKGELFENKIVFTIADNGPGVDIEKISNILFNPDKASIEGGYGIRNVYDRIKLYCGEGFGLSYAANSPRGTIVTVSTKLM